MRGDQRLPVCGRRRVAEEHREGFGLTVSEALWKAGPHRRQRRRHPVADRGRRHRLSGELGGRMRPALPRDHGRPAGGPRDGVARQRSTCAATSSRRGPCGTTYGCSPSWRTAPGNPDRRPCASGGGHMTDGSERDTTGGAAPSGSAGRRLIVAANRGPVSFHADASGEPVVTRGLGGLVSVLGALFSQRGARGSRPPRATRSAPGRSGARRRGQPGRRALPRPLCGRRCRDLPALLHDRRQPDALVRAALPVDLAWHPDIRVGEMEAWRAGYLPMNERFADAIVRRGGRRRLRCAR